MDAETIRLLAEMMSAQQGEASTTGSGQPSSSMLEGGMDMLRSIKAAKEKGPPSIYSTALKSPFLVRHEYIAGYNHVKKEQLEHERSSKNNTNSAAFMMRQTMKPLIEHGAAPTLKSLTPISLRQVARLGVNQIHADRVLFCTTSYAPHRAVGTQVLVEDDDKDCLTISLYNYVQEDEDPNQVLPVGTHLAVLAPYMKNARDDRQMILMLRCDNPQCIIKYDSKVAWLAAREGKPPPPETSDAPSLKERGNRAFRKKDIKAAEIFYSRALQSSSIQESDKIACWSNRAEVSLRSGQWEDAEQDARKVLAIDGDHVKAKFRLAKAQFSLGKPLEALGVVQELLSKAPKDRSFQDLSDNCERSIQEQQGHYDLPAMRKAARSSSCSTLQFHADYVSPDIEIGVDIEAAGGDKYRGCRAVRDIQDKEILSSSKALVFVRALEEDSMTMQLDAYSNRMDKGSQIRLVSELIALLQRRPQVGTALYNLSAGFDSDTVPLADTEMIDIPQIRRILSSNTFAVSDDGADVTIHWERRKEEKKMGRSLTKDENRRLYDKNLFGSGSGLWLTESMFNHSCTPNCFWTMIGDQIFIRCTRPILAGEELSISYTSIDKPYESRVEVFRHWITPEVGFECQCISCYTMRSDPKLRKTEARVEAAYTQAAQDVSFKHVTMAKAAERALTSSRRHLLLSDYERYPAHIQHCAAAKLHVFEGSCLNDQGDYRGALKAFQRAADIGYAVRGEGFHMGRAKDLWRIAGSAMRCKDQPLAETTLQQIWRSGIFDGFSSASEAREAFVDLATKYAIPWWVDNPDLQKYMIMENLARKACSDVQPSVTNSKTNRKKKKKGGRKL